MGGEGVRVRRKVVGVRVVRAAMVKGEKWEEERGGGERREGEEARVRWRRR